MRKRRVFWDLETSGLKPEVDRILEIGCLVIEPDGTELAQSWLLQHHINITAEITQLTGITRELIDAQGVEPRGAIEEFLGLALRVPQDVGLPRPMPLHVEHITHNGFRFDIPFVIAEVRRLQVFGDPKAVTATTRFLYDEGIDTAMMFKARKLGIIPRWDESFQSFAARVYAQRATGLKYNLDAALAAFEIRAEDVLVGGLRHRAMGDVHCTRALFDALLRNPVAPRG